MQFFHVATGLVFLEIMRLQSFKISHVALKSSFLMLGIADLFRFDY